MMSYATWIRRASWPLAVLTIALAANAALADDDAPPSDPPPRRQPPPPGEGPPPPGGPRERVREMILRYAPDAHLQMSVARVPAALDAQLELKGEGVLVAHVGSGGPADKAGIQANDVVLAAGDQSIKDPAELARIVRDSEGKELTLKLMRAGKPTTVTVTPAKSDATWETRIPRVREIEGNVREIEESIREKLHDLGADMRMQIIQPGAFLPRGADFLIDRRADFPDDLTVKITKEGKNPAQIEVKRGDKTWTVKENELAQLPDGVREPVEGLLGHGPMRFKIVGPGGGELDVPHPPRPPRGGPGDDGAGPPPPGGPDGPPPPRGRRGGRGPDEGGPDGPPRRGDRPDRDGPRPDGPEARGREGRGPDGPPERGPVAGNLERRLNEMSQRLQEMHEQLDGLRHHLREDRDDRPGRPPRGERPERPEPPPREDN